MRPEMGELPTAKDTVRTCEAPRFPGAAFFHGLRALSLFANVLPQNEDPWHL